MKMEGFQINYTDLSDLFWEYKRKIENLIENIDNCIEKINMFTENAVFTGKTGDAVKSYLGEAHITILSGIKVTAQTLLDNTELCNILIWKHILFRKFNLLVNIWNSITFC
jgi:hypothetical protein